MKEWQVMITDDLQTNTSFVFLYRELTVDQVQVYQPSIIGIDKTEIKWGVTTYETGELMAPSFVIPRNLKGLMGDFAGTLCKHFNVTIPEIEHAQSALEHQARHLEDLQKILFGFDYVTLERGKPITEERIVEVERPSRDIE